ncbi:MAG: hypothetical protein ACLR5S_00840 [Ruminococcus sp.]
MRNQEDEMLKKCLRQTMEQIQPDEETKKRMYLEIMRRASAAENAKTAAQKKRPWYLRWQTSTGICTAALLCVVIAAASIHSKMPDGTNQLEVVPPAAVTAVEPRNARTLRQNLRRPQKPLCRKRHGCRCGGAEQCEHRDENHCRRTGRYSGSDRRTCGQHSAADYRKAQCTCGNDCCAADQQAGGDDPCSGDFEESGHCDNGCTGGDNTAGDLKGAGNGDSSHPAEHLPVL